MNLDQLVEKLTLERYGPVVHDATRVPHLPLWLYRENWREELGPLPDDDEAIAAFYRRRTLQAQRDGRSRGIARSLRVLSDEEAEGVA